MSRIMEDPFSELITACILSKWILWKGLQQLHKKKTGDTGWDESFTKVEFIYIMFEVFVF